MPVGVVARNSVPKPQHVRHAQILPKHLRIVFLGKSWIPFLHFALQALFRCQQRPASIHLNRAALQYHASPVVLRKKHPPLQPRICFLDHLCVFLVVRIFGPPVKHKIVVGHLACGILHADRTRVTHPSAIGRHYEELHRLELRPRLPQNPANFLLRRATLHHQKNPLHLGKQPHNLGKRPRNRCKLRRPIRQLMRPPEPGSFMSLPLGGHPPIQPCSVLTVLFLLHAAILAVFNASAPSFVFPELYLSVSFTEPAARQSCKCINPAISEKRPISPLLLALSRIALHHEDFFLVVRRLREKLARRIRYKGISPKLNSRVPLFRLPLVSDAVHHCHVTTVCDRVRPLNRLPRIELCLPVRHLL